MIFFNSTRVATWFFAFALFGSTSQLLADSESGSIENFTQSPDFTEAPIPETSPSKTNIQASLSFVGAMAPASSQPVGALSGRIIFAGAGHGWTWGSTSWVTQRGVTWEMLEDYGTLDQMTLFAYYCFNAGATVVPMRPIGNQTNEVVIDNDSPAATFAGTWSNSGSTIYFGTAGAVPYRYASLNNTETATATYTPTIPVTGFYPVYSWVRHGSDRGDQLYRIRHSSGESQVRIPHYMVGNGWVYLGSYYFESGSNSPLGSVIISNLRGTTNGSVVIADAIRFGNGMGDINRGGGISSYPREEECARYWVQKMTGQGQSASLAGTSGTDTDQNVGAPIRMAKEMNNESVGNIFKRIYISFHSNAAGDTNTTARGDIGLYNNDTLFPGTATSNQFRLAQIIATEVNNNMKALTAPPLELLWVNNRSSLTYARSDYAFGEIRGDTLGYEMDATILEVAFHDNQNDSKLMRDSKARNWIARASYQAVVRYMNEFDAAPLTFLPEPPANVRALATNNGIAISWSAPTAMGGSGAPTNYIIYRSTNGFGFGNPVSVGGTTTSLTISTLAADTDFYFRVAAVNAGGESFPSETVGCRRSSVTNATRTLIVNGFTRLDRFTNLRQTPSAQNYKPPGKTGTFERVIPRAVNSFDYVVPHGKSISAAGFAFDSCHRDAVLNNQVNLTNYLVVVWAAGQDTNAIFNATAQTKITAFLNGGGNLFVSGSDVAWSLGWSGASASDRNFMQNQLHCLFGSDTNRSSGNWTVKSATGSIFVGNANAVVDDGTKGIYWVQTPDILTASGAGAKAALTYNNNSGSAAIQYDGSAGDGRVVFFGFPFETISTAADRDIYMARVLQFLAAPQIVTQPQSLTVNQGATTNFTVTAKGGTPFTYQWRFNGTNLAGATASALLRTNVQPQDGGNYSVVVSNLVGTVTSSNALLTVFLRPSLQAAAYVAGEGYKFTISGSPGSTNALQVSSNLVNWITLTNIVNTNGAVEFFDLSTNEPQRFYRAVH